MLGPGWSHDARWYSVARGAWKHDEAIHMLEARTEVVGLRRLARHTASHGLRHLTLVDDLSAVMSLERCRLGRRAFIGSYAGRAAIRLCARWSGISALSSPGSIAATAGPGPPTEESFAPARLRWETLGSYQPSCWALPLARCPRRPALQVTR